jgi:hypothetical protein
MIGSLYIGHNHNNLLSISVHFFTVVADVFSVVIELGWYLEGVYELLHLRSTVSTYSQKFSAITSKKVEKTNAPIIITFSMEKKTSHSGKYITTNVSDTFPAENLEGKYLVKRSTV